MNELIHRFDANVREGALVIDGAGTHTYRQLQDASVAIAEALRARGIHAGEVVGVDVGRGVAHLAALLGCWRVGAAPLLLDADAPDARKADQLTETHARVCLRAGDLLSLAHTSRTEEDLAYVVYTSGSSGRAKGVRVGHAGLLPVLDAQIAAFELDATSVSLALLAPAFDASLSDYGTALLAGARLVIPPAAPSPRELLALLHAHAITYVDLPPSLLSLLDPARLPASLRTVVIGGEPTAPALVRAWAARVRLFNVYGPTEATICTSLVRCSERWSQPCIGAPLPHVRYEVRDGELWIGGRALAHGYVDRPEIEAARFVEEHGVRWYRTGDEVRASDEGLVFVGRRDRQVKVRGRLICPEEIELALLEEPGVHAASVHVQEDRVVARVTADVALPTLYAALEARLPRWMVPRLELTTDLPRTVSGKIAHALDPQLHEWLQSARECLRCPTLSVDDDLPRAGLDSFAALELVSLAEHAGLSIDAARLRSARTLRGALESNDAPSPTAQLIERAAALADALPPRTNHGRGDDWLLTGANGFLGQHLLAELLEREGAIIHCVVRAPHVDAARTRLGAWGEHPRVRVHCGDVSAPRMNLAEYNDLCERVGHVVHAAAVVNLTLDLAALTPSNVHGALEIARFVRTGAHKSLLAISSLAVLVQSELPAGAIDERTEPGPAVHGGYAQSKLIAETLLRRAVPELCVVRPGLLTGHSRSGRSADTCTLHTWLTAVARLGCVPDVDLSRAFVDVTPVDRAAHAITAAACAEQRGIVHVASEHGVSAEQLVRALERQLPIARVGVRELLRRARAAHDGRLALALLGSMHRLLGTRAHREADLFLHTGYRFAHAQPAPTEAMDVLLDRYAAHAVAGARS